MNPEESQTPEAIDEWLEQIEVQPSIDEVSETLSTDLELETEASNQDVDFNSAIINATSLALENSVYTQAAERLTHLQQRSLDLDAEIAQLETTYKTLQSQVSVTQTALSQVVQESLSQLEQRKQALQISGLLNHAAYF
ncbi:DUF3086 domain-containing protein, partial [Dolichospermum sp. ST_sed10]|nr:DUF3086 domain-containing protein [Dolichospermum sp. ST_sed10]